MDGFYRMIWTDDHSHLVFGPIFGTLFGLMKAISVAEARPKLGKLVDLALQSKPVYIRRGNQVVQIVPAVMPDPIQIYPEGAFERSPQQMAALTRTFSEDESAPYSPH